MIGNGVTTGIVAVALGYIIGGIPSAYLVTRITTGKDIRKLGTGHTGVGNVGAHNVFLNVGKVAGVGVFVLDALKGAAAVAIALWVLGASRYFVLGAGLAAVTGHIWPVYLKFVGGGGLATTLGVFSILMARETVFALTFGLVIMVSTGNGVLSLSLSLVSVPLILWFERYPWWITVFPVIVLALVAAHWIPNIKADLAAAGGVGSYLAGLVKRRPPQRPNEILDSKSRISNKPKNKRNHKSQKGRD
jgi:glycerol-3-phosphate acyltransferase PlsY